MLSHAVHPPTTEHVYAQWQEREELLSRAPLGLLQEDNGQSLDVKEEEAVSPMSGELTSRNHFKTSRAVRLKFKGNAVNSEERIRNLGRNFFFYLVLCLALKVFTFIHLYREKGPTFKS